MIKFNDNLLTYKYIYILRVSNSGIITHVDENNIEHQLRCDPSLVLDFKRKTQKSSFRVGKKSCILFYDNYPVNIDTPTSLFFNINKESDFLENWKSKFENGIVEIKKSIEENFSDNFEQYIDGKFIYFLKKKTEKEIEETEEIEPVYKKIEKVSKDGFYISNVKSINIKSIGSKDLQSRTQIYSKKIIILHIKNPETNEYITSISPTISGGIKYKDVDTKKVNIDKINDFFYVNLNFILNSTKVVGETKGYESISFLNLEETLIQMNTVNLYSFPDYIRNITSINQSFKECLSWILGITYTENEIKNLVKYRVILSNIFQLFLVKKDYIDKNIKNIANSKIDLLNVVDLKEKYENLDSKTKDNLLEKSNFTNDFLI